MVSSFFPAEATYLCVSYAGEHMFTVTFPFTSVGQFCGKVSLFCPVPSQILVKLCGFVSPAEELAQKDDLQLLFSAITSWCPPHNLPWRKSAGEVLMTISRHGLSVNVVKYIHGNFRLSRLR